MTKCVIYVRVSSEDQVKGFSLAKQKNICYGIAQSLGIHEREIKYLEEPGISGETITDRPKVQQALQLFKSGRIEYAIAIDQDRWTRSVADWTGLFTPTFREYSIKIFTAQGEIDLTKRDHRLFSNIKGSISQWHKEYINEICRDGIRQSKDAGYWIGDIPIGYMFDRLTTIETAKGRRRFLIVKDPDRSAGVEFILDSAGKLGHRATAEHLGNGWDDATISRMRRNPAYAGLMKSSIGKLIKCKQIEEPYITVERFYEIQAAVRARIPRNYNTSPKYILTPLLKCGYCGSSHCTKVNISGKYGTRWYGYLCQGKKKGKSFCPKSKGRTMKYIDEIVANDICSLADNRKVLRQAFMSHKPEGMPEFAALVKQRDLLYTKRGRLIKAVEDDTIDLSLVKSRMIQIEREIQLTEERLNSLPAKLELPDFDILIKALKDYPNWPTGEKRNFCIEIIDRIIIWNSKLKIIYRYFDEKTIPILPLRRGRKVIFSK
jgi:site-specific DNA recombinase